MTPRTLSHDEKKAAEAAFRGLPMDPTWTAAAKRVYEGILQAMPADRRPLPDETGDGTAQAAPEPGGGRPAEPWDEGQASIRGQLASREEAIEAGALVDVSEQAAELGLTLPVGITLPLWENGITDRENVPEEERPARLRDLLMALRLHLVRLPGLPLVSQFPALLAFRPEPVPQVCVVSAIVHLDGASRPVLTLALPSEVSITARHEMN